MNAEEARALTANANKPESLQQRFDELLHDTIGKIKDAAERGYNRAEIGVLDFHDEIKDKLTNELKKRGFDVRYWDLALSNLYITW